MQKHVKRIIVALALSGILFLSSCSGENTADTTTLPVPESTQHVEQSAENLARVVEIPYENEYKATFTFNEKGLLVSSENCPWGADNDYYTYDEQNRITEIQHALWDGTIDDGCKRYVYSYDEKGNVERITVYRGSKDMLQRYSIYEFEYNAQGLVTKETIKSGGLKNTVTDTTENEYDENGRLIRSISNSYGMTTEQTYTYNEKGDIVQTVEKHGKNEYRNSYTYEYDESGNISKESYTGKTLESDESGNIVNEETTSQTTEYIYENGILKKEVSDSGIVEYEYYDNNRIVVIYWGGKEEPGEININAVPEVMGNYDKLMYYP